MRKLIVGLGTAVTALAVAGIAYAAVNVTFSATVSPSKANKPTALSVNVASTDDTPGALQPPIMNRIVMKLAGGKYNASKFSRCKLASLQARGPKGCPSKSKIGTGNGIGRARPVVEDPVNGKLTIFNGVKQGGRDTVLVYVFPDLGPTFVSVGKVIKKGKRKHYLIIAPRKCSGTWKGSGTFYFANGETKTVSISQKCKKR